MLLLHGFFHWFVLTHNFTFNYISKNDSVYCTVRVQMCSCCKHYKLTEKIWWNRWKKTLWLSQSETESKYGEGSLFWWMWRWPLLHYKTIQKSFTVQVLSFVFPIWQHHSDDFEVFDATILTSSFHSHSSDEWKKS